MLSHNLFRISDRIASHAWTLDELKSLHIQLQTGLQAEHAHVSRLDQAWAA
jgi:hypothetical protein